MKHKIEVKRTAHYYHEKAQKSSKGIVIVIHGYAQLAEKFIAEFKSLTTMGHDVYAPEALSKFYNRDRKPVASWMTSHEREDEIKDYNNYLNNLCAVLKEQHSKLPIHIIGFSQGVSTLLRWYEQTPLIAESIHLIAGSIPEELIVSGSKKLKSCYYYHGTEDKLVTKNHVAQYLEQLNKIGVDYHFIKFNGRHEIPVKLLEYFIA